MQQPPKEFSLLIKPASADCNLRCKYCFYLDRAELYPDSKVHRMSIPVATQMIRSYLSLPMRQYTFGWQGGEPTLMGVDFFRQVVKMQQDFARPGSVVGNGLQTNGTLIDDEFAELLGQYKFLLGVSLDGPPEVHDHYRLNVGGEPTHAKVLNGLEILKKHGVEFNILTLVNNFNGRDGGAIYRYIRDLGHNYHQYIPCVEYGPDGKPLPFCVGSEQWGEFLCGVFDEWYANDTTRVSVRLFDSLLHYYVNGVRNCCNMQKDCRQYFVVEHNGDVYPCDFFVRSEWKLGNVMVDDWTTMGDSELYQRFGARKRQYNRKCKDCKFLNVCAGDCPKDRLRGGENVKQLSHLCAGWKIFYEHALPGIKKLAKDFVAQQQQQSPGGLR